VPYARPHSVCLTVRSATLRCAPRLAGPERRPAAAAAGGASGTGNVYSDTASQLSVGAVLENHINQVSARAAGVPFQARRVRQATVVEPSMHRCIQPALHITSLFADCRQPSDVGAMRVSVGKQGSPQAP